MDVLKESMKISIIFIVLFLSLSFIQAQDINDTNVISNESGISSDDTVVVSTPRTYTDLFDEINETQEGSTLSLVESYKYNSSVDGLFKQGIPITKNITLIGTNNTYIDGSFIARGLLIGSNCSVILKNITFKNGYSSTHGGAINTGQNSTLLIEDCKFYSNKVYNSDGGAINGAKGTNIDIRNSDFYNNTAYRVSSLVWKEFKAGMGSAICMRIGSTLKLNGTVFRENIGSLTTILIITWDDVNTEQSYLYVDNCLFENNTARSNGIIYLDEFGIAEIINSVFRNNVDTYYGGTVALDTSNSAKVKNCTFEGNSAIHGGAIYINSYKSDCRSHVLIEECNFYNNFASEEGGAIYSKYGELKIVGSDFVNNDAGTYGGAIYTKIGSFEINNSSFSQNSAQYGGALFLKTEDNIVKSSSFIKNNALVVGGAVYTKLDVSSSNCIFSKNSAPKAPKVYGVFHAKVTKYVSASGVVKLKIVLKSPWKLGLSQKIKIKIGSYTSKWLKTNSHGVLTFSVPKKKVVSKKNLGITMDLGVCLIKSYVYKNPGKIIKPKSVKKPSNIKVTMKNSANNKAIKKTVFTVKVFTGKKYKTFKIKTNSKGVFKLSSKKLSRGSHKISVYLNKNNYYINKSFKVKIR